MDLDELASWRVQGWTGVLDGHGPAVFRELAMARPPLGRGQLLDSCCLGCGSSSDAQPDADQALGHGARPGKRW